MMTTPIDDTNNPKLILLKKFFIFNPKYGMNEEEVSLYTFFWEKCVFIEPPIFFFEFLFSGEKQNSVLSPVRYGPRYTNQRCRTVRSNN